MVLDAPLELAAGTTLDCRGHSISASRAAEACDTDRGCSEYRPSSPEVAIAINAARSVTVKNCTLRGFDFGIVVVNSKTPDAKWSQIELSSNVIQTRIGIEIVASDRVLVRNNRIEYGNGANGVGIVAWGDSDYNVFRDNTIVGRDVGGSRSGPQWPGGVPTEMRPDGIRTYSGTQARTVINVIVSGRLTQTVSGADTKQEGTVIEHNDVDIPTAGVGGYAICVADQSNTVVRDNTVHRAMHGVHVSGHMGMRRPPGTCSGDPTRFCLQPRDCFLPNVDHESRGDCRVPEPIYTFSTSTGLRFVSNHIIGPLTQAGFDCTPDAECSGARPAGIAVYPNAVSIVVEDNDISDVQFAGIELILKSIESAIVRRNIVRNSAYALALLSAPRTTPHVEFPSRYGAIISRNDFEGSRWRGVYVSPSFDLPAEISDPGTGEGNYWGHPCPHAFSAEDTSRATITDSHPFGQAVAQSTARAELPAITPCDRARK